MRPGCRGARAAAWVAAGLLAGCESPAAREWKCVGPVVELVKWRDQRENARVLGGEVIAPAALLAEEREHVATAVETLRPRRDACEMTWSVLMHQEPDNPALRLREEALLRVLDLPPRDYPAEAVGWSGATIAGRPAVLSRGPR